jgi:hypothetical protein
MKLIATATALCLACASALANEPTEKTRSRWPNAAPR